MHYSWPAAAFAFLCLFFSGVSNASNFEHREVSFIMEDTQKKGYINQAKSIGDTFDFNSFGIKGVFYFGYGYYLDTQIIGGYQSREDTKYYISDSTIGLKRPFAFGSKVDIIPEIGFQHALKGICSGAPCQTSIGKSPYIKLSTRAWVLPQHLDFRLSFRRSNSFHRYETEASIGYLKSKRHRIAIGYSDRSIGRGIRVIINYML